MFIDIHTHAFHPKIAYKAVDHLNNFYNVACAGDGTIDHLLAREKHAGVDKCVVLCAAMARPRSFRLIWAATACGNTQ